MRRLAPSFLEEVRTWCETLRVSLCPQESVDCPQSSGGEAVATDLIRQHFNCVLWFGFQDSLDQCLHVAQVIEALAFKSVATPANSSVFVTARHLVVTDALAA